MKALVIDIAEKKWDESRGFELRDLPRPTLDESSSPGDANSVILQMQYAGFCGSDRGLWNRAAFKQPFHDALERDNKSTRIVGHEFVGKIVEAGSAVKALYTDPDPQNKAKVEVGALVSGDSHVTCGRCYQCRIGEAHVCRDEAILGITTDGVFAEYVKIPAKNLWPIDESRIRPEVAAIMDPFGNAVHACTKVDMRGQRVAILGCGPIGLFSILLCKNFGAGKIIAVDIDKHNLELAKNLGADEVIQIDRNNSQPSENVVRQVMDLTYGKGVDVALEMAGPPSSINNAINITRNGGDIVLFGIKDGDLTIPNYSRLIIKGLTIHGVIGREIFKTWQTAQRLLSQKKNGIQEDIWNKILKQGEGTVYSLANYDKDEFESAIDQHAKLLFSFKGAK